MGVQLPASAPYVARHVQGLDLGLGQLKITAQPQMSDDMHETGSVESTVALPTDIAMDIPRFPDEEDVFFDCNEEDDEEVFSGSQSNDLPTRLIGGKLFGCSCV